MNPNDAPATKADLKAVQGEIAALRLELNADIKAEVSALDQRWEGKLDVRDQRLFGTMRGLIHESETRLLQAFYGYAQMDGNIGIFLNRLGAVEDRLLRVEKRLDMPPGA